MAANGRRLIEDFLPVEEISSAAASEKVGGRIGHPASLHLWWARRPLAAARAAVYAALVPAEGRERTDDEERKFFESLCQWGGPQTSIDRAREEVLSANDGKPPKVLDLFAGGGAIPLEVARLGGEPVAVELNPVAHLIERAMLEFPGKYPGIADDIRKWGRLWIERAWEQLKDLYPPITEVNQAPQQRLGGVEKEGRRPFAYLWTRTVRCPNPAMPEHWVPLVRQTWLGKKKGRMVALRPVVDRDALTVRYEVVQAIAAEELGFDPEAGSRRGQTHCLICAAPVPSDYIKREGKTKRFDVMPLAAVVLRPPRRGRTRSPGREYIPADRYQLPDERECAQRLEQLNVDPPSESLTSGDTKNVWVVEYGLTRFQDLFTPRQLLSLLTFTDGIRPSHEQMLSAGMESGRAAAVATYFGLVLNRVADHCSSLCRWVSAASAEKANNTYSRQSLPMVMDFAEANPFGGSSGDIAKYLYETADVVEQLPVSLGSIVIRSSATSLNLDREILDAVITDPPYYDNISYSDLSDFFFVWLKRSIGFLYPEHFGGEYTPKRSEAVVAPHRHKGSKDEARKSYEGLMAQSFEEAHRVLKPGAPLVCIYAHKTTLGWSTLVDALRKAGFTITEAWPLDTEMAQRSVGQGTASLASSIFLVGRKRDAEAGVGLESRVLADLDGIIEERLGRLQKAEISGSDLIIAVVGAGLRAFTRYERVERDNGEELPAERFLTFVQNRVLDNLFGNLGNADPVTRFYVAAQFSYGYAVVPFDEAKNLAYVTGVELDGPQGLTSGRNPLVAKTGAKVALRDFEERGEDPELGLYDDLRGPAPLIDVAHGVLWRAEHRPRELKEYLAQSRPDVGMLRVLIQTLQGKALREASENGKAREQAAAERMRVSWESLVGDNLLT